MKGRRREVFGVTWPTALTCLGLVLLAGCYGQRPSTGGGQTEYRGPRPINPRDILVPNGFTVSVVTTGLTFPTGIAFDSAGTLYVIEAGYSYGELWTTPRLLRIGGRGDTTTVATGGRNGPWTGITYAGDAFIISEGGTMDGGRILRVWPDGRIEVLVENLPTKGDHQTNGPAIGPDGKIYFGLGSYTNSGVVGRDNAEFGWLNRYPDLHDIPCRDVKLTGVNFETDDTTTKQKVSTGAFVAYGTATHSGQVVQGDVPCSGSILRMQPDGGRLELVAWGFRNPYAITFDAGGMLYVIDNGYDSRGSRPVFGAGDYLWRVDLGTWYGWPDYAGGIPLDSTYENHGGPALQFLLAEHPNAPPEPLAILAAHSSSDGIDISRSPQFGYVGEAFVAQFGDMAPKTEKLLGAVGYKIVRVNCGSGLMNDFAVNAGPNNGPASRLHKGGFERPVALRFDPRGDALYVVDFGVLTMTDRGPEPKPGTGVIWRISR